MNTMALLGILALVYAFAVFFITYKKPEAVWNMKKIQGFVKVLGKKGTDIFFYIWAIGFTILGIWLLAK